MRRQTFRLSSAAWQAPSRAGSRRAISTCPASLSSILIGAVSVPGESRDVRILPGLAQRDAATPDVMRGEETQLLGALGPDKRRVAGRLHARHAFQMGACQGWTVTGFSSFHDRRALRRRSPSIRSSCMPLPAPRTSRPMPAAFEAAVAAAFQQPALATEPAFHRPLRPAAARYCRLPPPRPRLSGTLIGLEIAGALRMPATDADHHALSLPGACRRFTKQAFKAYPYPSPPIDADTAVRGGLSAAARAIWPN